LRWGVLAMANFTHIPFRCLEASRQVLPHDGLR